MTTGGPGDRAPLTVVAALFLAASLGLTGCAAPGAAADALGQAKIDAATLAATHAVTVGGVERAYLARVPEGAAIGAPLTLPVLVVLHGAGGNSVRAEAATGLSAYAAANNFIVVYPNGTRAAGIDDQFAWNSGGCCGHPSRSAVDDVRFIDAVLDDVEATYTVDTERIFVTGFSNGGMMAYRLACELGDRIAGIAVVSGANNVGRCASDARLPLAIIHGTGDITVPYAGGPTNARTAERFGSWTNASVADATGSWVRRNDCDPFPTSRTAGTITTASYPDCAGESALEVVTIADGLHVWPLAQASGFDASDFIVRFFGLTR